MDNKINIQDIKSLKEAVLKNKRVFIRMDYNVPVTDNKVTDSYKIQSSFSTIKDVYKQKPSCIIIGSHLGRPKGKYESEYSCRPVYNVLVKMVEESFNEKLSFCNIEEYKEDKIVFVENLRFYPEEQSEYGDDNKILSTFFEKHVDIVVIDAFGVLHRNDFSVTKTNLPSYAGNLVIKELDVGLEISSTGVDLLILGGSKIQDKISILETLVPKCKSVFVVGALACSFLKYHFRIETGESKVEEGASDSIKKIYELSEKFNVKIYISHDYKIQHGDKLYYSCDIPRDGRVVDIGPKTLEQIRDVIKKSKVIFWNGPPGIFEIEDCSAGTKQLVGVLSRHINKVVVGGGETAASVRKFSSTDQFYHVSTGGGSFLKFLGGNNLPGLDVLKK
ncbi:hypothetical protein P3W45_001198 [Vairimorpha bombi]|jgi:phosphoglycerate kinase